MSRLVRLMGQSGIRRRGPAAGLACVLVAAVAVAMSRGGALTSSTTSAVGRPPPEWARNAGSWPAHNAGLSNTRANLKTVFALKQSTGKVIWKHAYHSVTPSGGPNGVALGYGLLFGETERAVFALHPKSGKQAWIRKLAANRRDGIDMAPQLYDGKLWGDPKANSGGGLWYPPAVDREGRAFIGIGNPGPYPNSQEDPNAKSRPGPNLYTDSLVALRGATGKLLWYRQITPHDLRDYDFQDSPIVTTRKIGGRKTEIVIGAGKSGKVVAFRADDGGRFWALEIGKHNRYQAGPLPAKPVVYCPGSLGGVETPMAESGNVLYVPWIDGVNAVLAQLELPIQGMTTHTAQAASSRR